MLIILFLNSEIMFMGQITHFFFIIVNQYSSFKFTLFLVETYILFMHDHQYICNGFKIIDCVEDCMK